MKKKFIVLFLSLTLLLNGCGNTATSKKSSELSDKYDYYQESVKNIQKNMNVDPDQADEIFLTLIDCGISELINMLLKTMTTLFPFGLLAKNIPLPYRTALCQLFLQTIS